MSLVRSEASGELAAEVAGLRLRVSADGLRATLTGRDGGHRATLRPLTACDTAEGVDETLGVEPPRVLADGRTIEVARRSTLWEAASTRLVCHDDALEVRSTVTGTGRLTDVRLLAGRLLLAPGPTGLAQSGSSFRTLFSPSPGDPARLVGRAGETAALGVVADSEPGRGHWFFTPAPLYLALTTDGAVVDPGEPAAEEWLGIGVAAAVRDLTFVQLVYEPGDRAFSLRLDYEGHTEVCGTFEAPALVLRPTPNPYAGLRAYRDDLAERGFAPPAEPRATPAWWHEPIFCGWGAQCHLAAANGGRAAAFATQASYDAFLDHLERQGVVPGTIVVDDKWQRTYGGNEPDVEKWPDLRGWIAGRHARGQRVLLWWRAWSPEGLPAELCVTRADGAPIALDPTSPGAREALRRSVRAMLAPEGLDADGLKVDFTAATPSGRALATHGEGWGIALLHELLRTVYRAAKEAKPDALVITHAPHPSFADTTDMLRLNDMLRLDDPGPRPAILPQMRFRAAVVRAACPELLVDTDDWCAPDLETWRAYLAVKASLGVPALYYVSHLDATGEQLTEADYAALAKVWEAYREARR